MKRLDDTPEPPEAGADIIDLKAARKRENARQRALAGIVPETREQVRRRMFENLVATAVVVVLVVGGAWLIITLRENFKVQACLESGRRNCERMNADGVKTGP